MESNSSQPARSSKKFFIIFLAITLLVVGAILAVFALESQKQVKKSTSASKEIPKLTVASFGAKNEIYPASMETENAFALNFQVFEGLVKYEERSKIVPSLATSWSNPDELTWRFKLKKDVKFHTGKTMTANDVVYSYKQAQNNQFINDVYLSTIESVRAVNDSELEIKTASPDPVILNKLVFLLVIDSDSDGKSSPIYGTGPYTLKNGTKPSEDKLELVAYDNYHGGRPQTRQLVLIQTTSDEESAELLLKKKANIAGDFLARNVPELDKKNMSTRYIPSVGTTFLSPITSKPGPLQNPMVRKALQYGLDVPKIIAAANLSAKQNSQLPTNVVPGYNPAIPMIKQDTEKAKQLLAEAGYPNGISLDFAFTEAAPKEITDEIKQQLAKANITMNNRVVGGLEELSEVMSQAQTDITYYAYGSDTFDSADVINGVLFADNQYTSPSIKKLLDDASVTIDSKKRLELLKDINQKIYDETAIIPLYSRIPTWYMDKPYVVPLDMITMELGVYYWKVHLK